MEYALGVDLGTTYTAAAVHVDGRVETVPLGGRRAEMPSLLHLAADGRVTVGESAERHGRTDPGRLVREVKRRLGDPVPLLVGGVPYAAHTLLARILRHVVDTATARHDGPPARVVVTHPANWGPYKREQLDLVFRGAGLAGVRTVTEPEAAAIHHASTERVSPGRVVGVYDLGGGTFDAAVLRRTGDGYSVLGTPEGIEQLGGADFDDAVFGHVTRVLGDAVTGLDLADEDVTAALARLRRECVEAKEALSDDPAADIAVALPGLHTRVRLTRTEFEALIRPALDDTVAALRRALASAGASPDLLLLSGGSSRIPLVAQLLTTAFDRPVVLDPHPEHSIALGAALLAGREFAPTRIGAIPPVPPVADPPPAAPPPAPRPPATPPAAPPPAARPPTTPPATPPAPPPAARPPATPPAATPPAAPLPPAAPGRAARAAAPVSPATTAFTATTPPPALPAPAAGPVRGVAGVPAPPPRADAPEADDPPGGDGRARTRRRVVVAAAFFGVLLSTGAATAWALQSGDPEPDDPVVTAGSAPAASASASPSAAPAGGTETSPPPPERPATTAPALTVSVRLSADRTSADDACEGFGGLTVRARISANRTTTVDYRWSTGDGTIDRGSVRVPGGERRSVAVTHGGALAPGESASARVRITLSSPAGTTSRSIRLSFSCPEPGPEPGPGDSTGPDPDGSTDPSVPPGDGGGG
jgi:molecular chaperone DnaK